MNDPFQLRIALVAPSGSGKSTTAQFLRHYFESAGFSVEIIKLAEPLYQLQRAFYDQACMALPESSQNQRLLEFIAQQLRSLDSQSLIRNFAHRLGRSRAQVIINDDLRDDTTDWPYLRDEGFQTIKIVTDAPLRQSRLGLRGDISIVEKSDLDLQTRRIKADYVLPNNGSLELLEARVAVVASWAKRASQKRVAS